MRAWGSGAGGEQNLGGYGACSAGQGQRNKMLVDRIIGCVQAVYHAVVRDLNAPTQTRMAPSSTRGRRSARDAAVVTVDELNESEADPSKKRARITKPSVSG